MRLKYSTERTVQDIFSAAAPEWQKIVHHRSVRLEDLKAATLYQQQFSTEVPETIPETIATEHGIRELPRLRRLYGKSGGR